MDENKRGAIEWLRRPLGGGDTDNSARELFQCLIILLFVEDEAIPVAAVKTPWFEIVWRKALSEQCKVFSRRTWNPNIYPTNRIEPAGNYPHIVENDRKSTFIIDRDR